MRLKVLVILIKKMNQKN